MSTSSGIPKQIEDLLITHRRGFLRNAGLFAVSIGVFSAAGAGEADAQSAATPQVSGPYPNPDFHQIDSWIVIHENNTATFYVGKTDPGQGTGTAFRQLMSDELDIAFDKTACIMGSTDITVDQVGAGGSSAIERDSLPMRRVAAEARRVLLGMASIQLGTPVDQLAVSGGVITVKGDSSKRVTYGELIGGKKFNVALTGGSVNAINGQAKIKQRPDFKYTGQSLQRDDIPAKVDGSLKWAIDVKLPGMVHARNVKPPFACAKLIGIGESPVKGLPGFIKVMNKGNYVAVVCEREEQAINAARALKTTWEKPSTAPFPSSEDLFDYCAPQHPQGHRGLLRREIPTRHSRARQRRSKPSTRSLSRDIPRSPALMPWRTLPTVR
jgi:nicotinate dehydrogenase subunit B